MELRSLKEAYPQFKIGEGSYGGLMVFDFDETTKIEIGNYCSFAFGTKALLGGQHRMDWVTTFPFSHLWDAGKGIPGHPASRGDIVIGSDVWVGAEAMILSGVKIGDGAVIGARALVTRDVLPYEVVTNRNGEGMPPRFRFSGEVVERLLALKWWDWPKERIEKALPMMLSKDIFSFISQAELSLRAQAGNL